MTNPNSHLKTARVIVFLAAMMPSAISLSQSVEAPSVAATIEPSHKQLFENQVFELTLSLHAVDVQVGNRFSLTGLPSSDRFELRDFHELPMQRKSEGNRIVTIRRFRCEARAVSPGATTISPLLHILLLQRRQLRIGSTWQEVPHDVSVRPIVLEVASLPDKDRPDGFSGAVGQFSFHVDIYPLDVAAGDLITATMKVSGKGYLGELQPPGISSGRHFKVYDPKPVDVAGPEEKIFEQVIIPQTTNATEIPQVCFSFFDPIKGTYQTVERGPFNVTFHAKTNISVEPYSPDTGPEKPLTRSRIEDTPIREHIKAYAWIIAALVMIVLGSATVILRLMDKVSTGMAAVLLIVINMALVVSIVLAFTKADLSSNPEAVVNRSATARIAPGYSADATFAVPEDSTVRVLDSYRDWVKISYSDKRGWIPQSALNLSQDE
jgi:hypothetical protein